MFLQFNKKTEIYIILEIDFVHEVLTFFLPFSPKDLTLNNYCFLDKKHTVCSNTAELIH